MMQFLTIEPAERPMHSSRGYFGCLLAVLSLLSLACSDDPGPGPPPSPQALQMVDGDGQQVRRGEQLPLPLRVRVLGPNETPLPDVRVQWAVTRGDAVATPTASVSNSNGDAETRIVMRDIGEVVVNALVPGVLPVTFILRGLDPCNFSSWASIPIGTSVAGSLLPPDCQVGGQFFDVYPFYADATRAVILSVQSPGFDPELQLHSNERWFYYFKDSVNATRHARMKAILSPGSYALVATSIDEGGTGPYTARVMPTTESQESCEFVLVMVGAATTQNLASTDCAGPFGRYEDSFAIVLWEGETVTLTHSSRHFTPYIGLVRNGEVIAEADGTTTGPAVLTFESADFADYYVHLSSTDPQQSGEYRFFLSRGAPANPQLSRADKVGLLGSVGGLGGPRRGFQRGDVTPLRGVWRR